ncbi:hypothetical protein Bca101_058474 [Brassica carinata]
MKQWLFWFSLITRVLPFGLAGASDCELDEYPNDNRVTEELLISLPDSAENMLSIVDVLTKCGSVDVIVVDSVSSHSFIPDMFMYYSFLASKRNLSSV